MATTPACEGLFAELLLVACEQPLDEEGEHLFRVLGRLAFDVRDYCARAAAA